MVVALVSWALKASKLPKFSSMAAASSPSGLPPPSGERFVQNSECRTWPDRLKAWLFSNPTIELRLWNAAEDRTEPFST